MTGYCVPPRTRKSRSRGLAEGWRCLGGLRSDEDNRLLIGKRRRSLSDGLPLRPPCARWVDWHGSLPFSRRDLRASQSQALRPSLPGWSPLHLCPSEAGHSILNAPISSTYIARRAECSTPRAPPASAAALPRQSRGSVDQEPAINITCHSDCGPSAAAKPIATPVSVSCSGPRAIPSLSTTGRSARASRRVGLLTGGSRKGLGRCEEIGKSTHTVIVTYSW